MIQMHKLDDEIGGFAMTNPKLAIAVTMAALVSAGLVTFSAGAQNPSTPPPPPQLGRPMSPNGGSFATGHEGTNQTPNQNSLGNELSHSNGVITPPSTRDQGVLRPPANGTQSTPVIPPPGTPGGNQNVQPK
jgi:hypothetical protein